MPALEHTGKGLLPYFPLASGLLTGKYKRGADAPAGSRLAAQPGPAWPRPTSTPSRRWRSSRPTAGCSMLQVAIGGLAAMPTVASVIAGATSVEQVRGNVEAGTWEPSDEDLAELRRITA